LAGLSLGAAAAAAAPLVALIVIPTGPIDLDQPPLEQDPRDAQDREREDCGEVMPHVR